MLCADNLGQSYQNPEPLRDASMATLEKILCRIDQFYQAIVSRGVNFAVYPSPAAFELYLAREREKGVEFHVGDWDRREGGFRVWRRVELSRSELEQGITEGRGPGYWVKTDVIDWLEQEKMVFV